MRPVACVIEDSRWNAALGGDPAAFAARFVQRTAEGRGQIVVLFADDGALQALNRTHRGKDTPTNVLSFPAAAQASPSQEGPLLGDIALAYETIAREAHEQGKTFSAHAGHMLVHGTLHLLGYDHQTEAEAEVMEAQERRILASLGVSDPYMIEPCS